MRETSLEEVLDTFFRYKITDMFTAIPCRVVTIKNNLEDQRVDVQPMPLRKLRDGGTSEIPTILNVPLLFPASKKAAMTFPVEVGDTVLCVFSQRSLDGFKASSSSDLYEPQDSRKFSLRDACAIPGLFPFDLSVNDPAKHTWSHSTNDVVLVNNIGTGQENEVRLKDDGDIELKTNQEIYSEFSVGTFDCSTFTVNCNNMFVNGDVEIDGNLNVTGNADVGGNIEAGVDISAGNNLIASVDAIIGGISFLAHVHGGVAPGGSTTTPPA